MHVVTSFLASFGQIRVFLLRSASLLDTLSEIDKRVSGVVSGSQLGIWLLGVPWIAVIEHTVIQQPKSSLPFAVTHDQKIKKRKFSQTAMFANIRVTDLHRSTQAPSMLDQTFWGILREIICHALMIYHGISEDPDCRRISCLAGNQAMLSNQGY